MPVLRKNRLRELIRQGQPSIGTSIHSSWPGTMEIIGHAGGIDYVEFTSTYAPFDLYSLDNMSMASELFEMSTMIKLDAEPKTFLAQRALGAGIQNVLFADLRSAGEVGEAIQAVRAEPEGHYGAVMQRSLGYLLEIGTKKFVKYTKDVVVAVMVEKKSLYEEVEDLMNLEGVDMIQFGPGDFSMSLGLHEQWEHPKVVEAEERTIKLAQKYDKAPRIEIYSNDGFEKRLNKYMAMGVQHYLIGIDVVILYEWLKHYSSLTRKALKVS